MEKDKFDRLYEAVIYLAQCIESGSYVHCEREVRNILEEPSLTHESPLEAKGE